MSFVIGLTGSIGMGKSTTAELFRKAGCPVWDADAAVHRLYGPGGLAVEPMSQAFPEAIIDGLVSRDRLKQIIGNDPSALKVIETIVHPLVAADRQAFLEKHKKDIVVLDVPLLFEIGAEKMMDAVVVVSVDAQEQRRRVMERGTMTPAQFEAILAKQTPDAEKRARATYVVITDTVEHAQQQVEKILREIQKVADARNRP